MEQQNPPLRAKVIGLVLICIIIYGFVGYAIANQNRSPKEEVGTSNPTRETPLAVAKPESTAPTCTLTGPTIDDLDRTSWKSFEGFGFALKYPSDLISIKSVGNPYTDKDFGFEVSTSQ